MTSPTFKSISQEPSIHLSINLPSYHKDNRLNNYLPPLIAVVRGDINNIAFREVSVNLNNKMQLSEATSSLFFSTDQKVRHFDAKIKVGDNGGMLTTFFVDLHQGHKSICNTTVEFNPHKTKSVVVNFLDTDLPEPGKITVQVFTE